MRRSSCGWSMQRRADWRTAAFVLVWRPPPRSPLPAAIMQDILFGALVHECWWSPTGSRTCWFSPFLSPPLQLTDKVALRCRYVRGREGQSISPSSLLFFAYFASTSVILLLFCLNSDTILIMRNVPLSLSLFLATALLPSATTALIHSHSHGKALGGSDLSQRPFAHLDNPEVRGCSRSWMTRM